MQSDVALAQQAIRLLHEKEQETMRLLELAMSQNQALLAASRQQQEVMTQQLQTINWLAAELCAYRSAQQAAFSQVHTN